jgi:transposase
MSQLFAEFGAPAGGRPPPLLLGADRRDEPYVAWAGRLPSSDTLALPEEARRSQVTVLRLAPAEPGAEAQIEYGRLYPATERRHTGNAFAMVLCWSRPMFVRPTVTMDQRAWTECHVAAFGFFGGVPARLVPDNLRIGVDRPDLYDPKINRSYAVAKEVRRASQLTRSP